MSNAQNEHLERLIAQIAKGDRADFDTFYDMTSAQVHALCVTILNDRPAAEETLRDVYVAVWKQARNFSDVDLQPMTWLVSMARTRAVACLRAQGPAGRLSERKAGVQLFASAEGGQQPPEAGLQHDGPLARLKGVPLQNLRDTYLHGLTYDDLARRNNISVAQARDDMKTALLGLDEDASAKLTPAQQDQLLAAELALGLLDDDATELALSRKSDEPDFGRLVRGWQEYLAPLATSLTPIMAPARARQRTRETLGFIAAPLAEDPTEKTPWYRGWLGIAALLLAIVAVLAYLLQMDAG